MRYKRPGVGEVEEILKMPTRFTESMVVVSMGFGATYWIIDTLFYILASDVSSGAPLFHLNPRDIGCV